MSIVNSSEFARLLDVDEKTVRNWIDAGMPAQRIKRRGSPVRIQTGEALRWWLARELEQYQIAQPDDEINRAEAERQLVLERKRKLELENRLTEQELCTVSDVVQAFARAGVAFRTNTDAIAGRICQQLSAMSDPDEIRQFVLSECRASANAAANELETYFQAQIDAVSTADSSGGIAAEDA